MIKSEIASCRNRRWVRKISLPIASINAARPLDPDPFVAVLFTLCDAKMAKFKTITIAGQPL
ncbi:hypothetical protein CK230_09160 [Mesorhizobium sp. WSM3859]|nr:hypothetical protein CK230_09160 [Mesorhizobium sp. WSM3859]